MIAIARRNLSCLWINPNSFICNSNAHFFPSFHFFSTWTVKKLIPNPEIYDLLLNKHQFPPDLASLASSCLPKSCSPITADSVVSFLKENSFTVTQLQKVVTCHHSRILGFTIESMNFKFNVFQNLGLSPKEIAKVVSENPVILHSSYENRIIPKLSTLKCLLGSDHDLARLLKRCSWFLLVDLEKTLMPNMEILKSCSIPMERILHFLHLRPRCFLVKPDIMRKSVVRAIEFGVPWTSGVFIQALNLFTYMSEGMWEVKVQTLRDLGLSDDDILTIFWKQPLVFSQSGKKMKNVTELLLATGKYDASSIVTCPVALMCSTKKRLEPRLQILRLLESRSLIEKWPALSTVAILTEDRFFDRLVKPYCDELGKEHITKIYVEDRKR
ncbi:uncharacterized protein LOC131013697 [Salvia miltiorrhiza]|uniref:uncharacterized protein LOC131013697 n=1 Tax=Salvia miltiorrhiza TaxID=226208 RepID=UPI0025AC45C8|nr:uncharacterized protein LOC131013697 [Salvia miltiorrhiza]